MSFKVLNEGTENIKTLYFSQENTAQIVKKNFSNISITFPNLARESKFLSQVDNGFCENLKE